MVVCPQCGSREPRGRSLLRLLRAPLTEPRPAREQRKTVTVLFCDVTGSTELGERLDPEALRALLARYFERMKAIVERHGGTVEKFIGDAVMAVFGVPVVHEDDALRALRAAVEMREAFPELGVQGRIGVTTGEVVTGTEERLATGDAVNVAARLEQAAQPGEILIGDETLPADARRRRGRAGRAADAEGQGRAGRGLPAALRPRRARASPAYSTRRWSGASASCAARERLRRGSSRSAPASCSRSSARPGSASPGWSPSSWLARRTRSSCVAAACPTARASPTGPWSRSSSSCPSVDLDPVARETIRGLLGDEQLVTSSDEIAWAFRKLLEAVAAERPLVCVFDDVHWGEETFLDLVEHVADLSRDAPILLLCMARPELLDRRTGWGGGKVNATTVLLEPLAPEETERLIESLAHLDDGLRAGSARRPRATRSSSRRWSRSSRSRATARSPCRRRSRRCSPPASTSSIRASGTCSSAARSRGASSTAARCRRWRPRSRR